MVHLSPGVSHLFRRRHYQLIRAMPYMSFSGKVLEGIRQSRSDTFYRKPNLPWGFSIYRCTYKDNIAWHNMLQLIQQTVHSSADLLALPEEERTELLESHDLVIHDHPEKLDGATSHEVRDHFNDWVARQLPKVVSTPEVLQRLMEEYKHRPHGGPQIGPEYILGARHNFALFVDDICLESLVHMNMPVVKILYKQWGNLTPEERKYTIHPDWHDGVTAEDEEDVGWMYMCVVDYVEMYNRFEWAHLAIWHDTYTRPPQMVDYYDSQHLLPGFWRK